MHPRLTVVRKVRSANFDLVFVKVLTFKTSIYYFREIYKTYIQNVFSQVDAGDGSYPSVNTCVHYLKLPEYSCKEVLRERLLAATNERGFHLN